MSWHAPLAFLAGFFVVWSGFGLAAFLGDAVLHAIVDATPWLAARPWLIEAGVHRAGGRLAVRARQGPLPRGSAAGEPRGTSVGSFGRGASHGVACLGASWALMLLMFAEGFGGLGWMGALTGVMILETYLPSPRRLSSAVGVGLILLALLTLSGPFV